VKKSRVNFSKSVDAITQRDNQNWGEPYNVQLMPFLNEMSVEEYTERFQALVSKARLSPNLVQYIYIMNLSSENRTEERLATQLFTENHYCS
jgi:hypothetical protein